MVAPLEVSSDVSDAVSFCRGYRSLSPIAECAIRFSLDLARTLENMLINKDLFNVLVLADSSIPLYTYPKKKWHKMADINCVFK